MSRAGVGTQDASGRTGSLNDRLIDGAGKGDDKKNDTFAAGCLLKQTKGTVHYSISVTLPTFECFS